MTNKEKLLELEIELEDIAVELNDRAENEFDDLLVRRLNKVIFELQNMGAV
jgi:hypothetical protein